MVPSKLVSAKVTNLLEIGHTLRVRRLWTAPIRVRSRSRLRTIRPYTLDEPIVDPCVILRGCCIRDASGGMLICLIFAHDAAHGQFFRQIEAVPGADTASVIQSLVERAHNSGDGNIAAPMFIGLRTVGEVRAGWWQCIERQQKRFTHSRTPPLPPQAQQAEQ